MKPVLAQADLDRELQSNFRLFLFMAFRTLHGGKNPRWNWHIDAICHAVEETWSQEGGRLLITIPPRHLKSIAVSVAHAAFLMGKDPIHAATGTALHGQSYATRDPGRDLAADYPAPIHEVFNIGVLHTALSGGRPPHAPYAPCTPQQLAAKGYRYWALGHVHDHEIVATQPYIVFPGNLQGRHIREIGAKGAVIVDVLDGEVDIVRHIPLDAVRWARVEVDLQGCVDDDAAHARVREALQNAQIDAANGRPLMVRVTYVGESRPTRKVGRASRRNGSAGRVHVIKRAEIGLLRWAIDRYRAEKQAPLLKRASELFSILTLGRYNALTIDASGAAPAIFGVTADGAFIVPAARMSEGAVDQLYLSLRLAAVEDAVDQGIRLPFLADDLFINYDDQRAAAGFKVLAALAAKTQVLFFTHHDHLIPVAERAFAGTGTAVCRLGT